MKNWIIKFCNIFYLLIKNAKVTFCEYSIIDREGNEVYISCLTKNTYVISKLISVLFSYKTKDVLLSFHTAKTLSFYVKENYTQQNTI